MWEPQPGWLALPTGAGMSTVGVWRTHVDGRPVVVKRLAAPTGHDPAELTEPRHFAYWRRQAEVARSGVVATTPGLRSPLDTSVEEDEHGITLVQDWVDDAAVSGLFAAHALGRFAAADLGDVPWLARDQLRDRLRQVERRGGWTMLMATTVAEVADRLWRRRTGLLDRVDELPQVAQHGDPTPHNLPGREGDDVVALDWGMLGHGPVGGDLGYHLLSAREAFEPLVDAYLLGLPYGLASRGEVELGTRVSAVYTAFTRADWALRRVGRGGTVPAGAFRHPSVALHLRQLQRLVPQVEALL